MLYHLLYISELKGDAPLDMDAIVQSSRDYNKEHHITGALWFDGTTFVQMLEGDRVALTAVLARIMRSNSHHKFELVFFEPAPERIFSDWSMAYYHASKDEQDIVKKFATDGTFKPRQMSAQSLVTFMRYLEMARHVSTANSI
ncbi:BLUF domain-containing protein [Kordiimonas lacus]|uniref:Sensors of blue-light using FAD n=1 Tax=Kordiimonas lacus TaxID=637679 RepID=A0A1G6UBD6_9PROT|nr:BLUF domain-containing protein [Kordiimonas lacus]SDD38006.1 Sensors of blue-light using FAD [Kordiimonas lacus]